MQWMAAGCSSIYRQQTARFRPSGSILGRGQHLMLTEARSRAAVSSRFPLLMIRIGHCGLTAKTTKNSNWRPKAERVRLETGDLRPEGCRIRWFPVRRNRFSLPSTWRQELGSSEEPGQRRGIILCREEYNASSLVPSPSKESVFFAHSFTHRFFGRAKNSSLRSPASSLAQHFRESALSRIRALFTLS